jgi:hypothetical protein
MTKDDIHDWAEEAVRSMLERCLRAKAIELYLLALELGRKG